MVRQNGMKTGSYYIFLDLYMDQHMKLNNYIHCVYGSVYKSIINNQDLRIYGYKSEDLFNLMDYKTLLWVYGK
jgi:hypothetical protein